MTTLSPKYQVVIPKEIRESMNLKPGMKMEMVRQGDVIRIVLVKDIKVMRGALKGVDTNVEREKTDRTL
jgi:AbrB family looped-hinge helix DNA binding protein